MKMKEAAAFFGIFQQSVNDYHIYDDINRQANNPYPSGSMENLLYAKNWIDTVQWHYEDLIRNPAIDAHEGMLLKRKIDASNQHRTDLVEQIDELLYKEFENIQKLPDAVWNTETPAWAIDRLSILALKIYHMQAEAERKDASEEHIQKCTNKLNVLLQQKTDLIISINWLLADLQQGKKYMKMYKQMKMYNDESLNPVLCQTK